VRISIRSVLAALFDLAAPVFAWVGAFLLRFNFEWHAAYERQIALALLVVVPAHFLICRYAGLYRGLWIFASLPDLKRVLRVVAMSSLVLVVFVALYRRDRRSCSTRCCLRPGWPAAACCTG